MRRDACKVSNFNLIADLDGFDVRNEFGGKYGKRRSNEGSKVISPGFEAFS
jgi:hypothetical protein